MRNLLLPVTLLLLLGCCEYAQAQYHLQEVGVRVDAGPTYATGTHATPAVGETLQTRQHLGVGTRLSGFYSHYICGKAYGYHLEGAVAGNLWLADGNAPADAPATLLHPGLQAGAFFKFRRQNYHRQKEWFALLGLRMGWNLSIDDAPAQRMATVPLVLAPEASLWYRFPRTRNQAWLLGLGASYYPTMLRARTNLAPSQWPGDPSFLESPLSGVHLWLGLGTTLWSNR